MNDAAKLTAITQLQKLATDRGELIEAGWCAFHMVAIGPDDTQHSTDILRVAFFSGAEYLFTSLMVILSPENDPTAADMQRMDMIYRELQKFQKEYALRFAAPQGNG